MTGSRLPIAIRPSQVFLKMSLVVTIVALLFGTTVLPVRAAEQPEIAVFAVIPGARVTLQIYKLPPQTDFYVTEGPAGSRGINGGYIAHFNSGDGGIMTLTFEVFVDLRASTSGDIRIDSRTGYAAWANFNPSSSVIPSVGVPSTITATTETSTTTNIAASTVTVATAAIQILHVEQGGLVTIEADNFPLNTEYAITIGVSGSQGNGGYLIAHLPVGTLTANVASIEIPTPLMYSPVLEMRITGPGFLAVKIFRNREF